MKNFLFAILASILFASLSYAQDMKNLITTASEVYTGQDAAGNDLVSGFSMGALVGGFMFGVIGLAAFIYGKKSSEFKPMLIGIALMAYPYFVKNTIAMYLVGVVLTAALFLWRE